MKNFKTLFSLALVLFVGVQMVSAQQDTLLVTGFPNNQPSGDGWSKFNVFWTGSLDNAIYEGEKSLRLRRANGDGVDSSYFISPNFNLLGEISLHIAVNDEEKVLDNSEMYLDYSIDDGSTWINLLTTTTGALETEIGARGTYKKYSFPVNQEVAKFRILGISNLANSVGKDPILIDDLVITKMRPATDNAGMDSILINDGYMMAVKDQLAYNINLLHTTAVVLDATSVDPEATVTVVQPTDVFSDTEADRTATVTIKSKDESVSIDYSIVLNVTETLAFIDFSASTLYDSFYSAAVGYITGTPADGQNTLPANPASFSFVTNSILEILPLENVATLAFNMALRKKLEGDFDVELYQYVGSDSTLLETINSANLTTTEWKEYSIAVNVSESVSFKFISSQTGDHTTRIFIDDISVTKGETTGLSSSKALAGVEIYPNPAQDQLTISGVSGDFTVAIYSLSGASMLSSDNIKTMDISSLSSGSYLVKVTSNQQALVQKLIVE